jgi:hypothetical protein
MTSQNDRDSFNWLHFGNWLGPEPTEGSAYKDHWNAFLEDLDRLHDGSGPWDAIFITGDIARTGADREYDEVTDEITHLLDRLSKLGSAPAVLTVPGAFDIPPTSRHDSEFWDRLSEDGNLVYPWSAQGSSNFAMASGYERLSSLLMRGGDPLAGNLRKTFRDYFKAYDDWSDKSALPRPETLRKGTLPGDYTATLSLGPRHIGIAGLNTDMSRSTADPRARGTFSLDPGQLVDACDKDADQWAGDHDTCLLLTHAPPSWLGPEARRAFYSEIAPPFRFSLHLCSQFDPNDPLCVRDGPMLLIQAPPFRAERKESRFIAGTISFEADTEMVTLRARRYVSSPRAKFVADPTDSPAPHVANPHSARRTRAPILSRTPPVRSGEQPEAPIGLSFLEIRNFRCIDRIGINFEPPSRLPGRWICLAGINGAGKTSILQALALVLLGEPLYRELGGDRLDRYRRLVSGIRQKTRLRAWVRWGTGRRYLEIKHGDKDAMTLPPGGYYPPTMGQHWNEIRSKVVLAYGATRNLSDYVDTRYTQSSPDVRRVITLFDPLTQVTSAEFLLQQNTSEKTPRFRLFKRLLQQVFGDDLSVQVHDGRIVFTARDEPVEGIDLPDGFRSSIAWLADLCATWCEKNEKRAPRGKPSDIEAIVLIDEIDLHLHPSLQRILVPRLREALPRVQWIVTTHSPLVLSSFDTAEIIALDRDEPGGVRFLDRQILGFTTDQIYTWLMGTPPTSAAIEQELARNGTPGPHSEEEVVELLMMSPEVSADEAKEQARQRRERLKRLSP